MQEKQAKYGIFMTVAACLWLGLFPLLQGLTYALLRLSASAPTPFSAAALFAGKGSGGRPSFPVRRVFP